MKDTTPFVRMTSNTAWGGRVRENEIVSVKIIRDKSECKIEYDINNPPYIYFDTNVWIGINDEDINMMKKFQNQRGFRYCYSSTNFIELISHLDDLPTIPGKVPFLKYKACFRKILNLCNAQILPSPEEEFLTVAGLQCYIDPVWIINFNQMALEVEAIVNANDSSELSKVINISHYKNLRETDQKSMSDIMKLLPQTNTIENKYDEILQWFMRLAYFFLLERPSINRITYDKLTKEEKNRFNETFTRGAGSLFFNHCMSRVRKVLRKNSKIDPNDLYDMLQLILLWDENRIFITNENSFFYYVVDTNQRVLSWEQFRESII
ncbi:MAG: hypothetical protein AABZ11_03170 [Nitrospinota bacterium]